MKKKNSYIKYIGVWFVALVAIHPTAAAQSDSLSHYLELAARHNQLLQSDFTTYKASLEKIPQAGAYADPQLEMGFFLKPMEIIDGKQVADFKLMQMFPWFGTRKAARNEATEMSRMAYQKFRETRDKLFFEVKSQWYALTTMHRNLRNIQENKALLTTLKELATNRFSASGGKTTTTPAVPSTPAPSTQQTTSAMAGMGGGTTTSVQPQQTTGSGMGASMGSGGSGMGGSAMGGSSSGMSDVLRVQLELNELDNEQQMVLTQITAAQAKFNALLNRELSTPVSVPEEVEQLIFPFDDEAIMETIIRQNPMLAMLAAESDAYKAKLSMDKKMGLPMLGIGLQYSVISKRMDMGIPTTQMNGMDMVMPMVSVTIPLYRKKYTALQNESRLMKQAADEKYANTLNTIASEYITTKQQLLDAARKVTLYQQQRKLAETTYDLAVKEFASGQNSMTNVLDIQRQLLDYEFKQSESIAAYNTVIAMLNTLISEPQTD